MSNAILPIINGAMLTMNALETACRCLWFANLLNDGSIFLSIVLASFDISFHSYLFISFSNFVPVPVIALLGCPLAAVVIIDIDQSITFVIAVYSLSGPRRPLK